jgi:Zn-dependent protease/predicted transcriptional regulator
MRWSLRLFTLRGIPVRVHVSFLLILVWAAFIGFSERGRNSALGSVSFMLVFTLLLFGCVVLHELGHSLVAQRFGVRVHDITLWPIGGVARLAGLPKRPLAEFVITAAGPLVNLVLALLFGVAALAVIGPDRALTMALTGRGWFRLIGSQDFTSLLVLLTLQNLLLVVFNLLPAFPLDGGRLLRSFLAALIPFRTATRAASYVGQGLAVALVGLSFLPPRNFFLALVGAFVFLGAWQERSQLFTQERLARSTVRDAMQPLGRQFAANERVAEVAREIASSPQQVFLVGFDESVTGLLTRDNLFKAVKKASQTLTVGEVASRAVTRVAPETSLEDAQGAFGLDGAAVVVEDGRMTGLLTRADIARLDAALEVLGS